MARTASPWFWGERQGWYVNKHGRRHFLGEHPGGAAPPRKIKGTWNVPPPIVQAFHALMARPDAAPKPPQQGSGPTVAELLDKYLDWCHRHRAERTYEWYRDHLQRFLDALPAATMDA
jgi:hypothetical protein